MSHPTPFLPAAPDRIQFSTDGLFRSERRKNIKIMDADENILYCDRSCVLAKYPWRRKEKGKRKEG